MTADQPPRNQSASALRGRLLGGGEPEVLERLVYLFGSARGGTSFLKSVIGLHPGVISFVGPTHFVNNVWRHRWRVADRLWCLIFWMPFNDALLRLEQTLAPDETRRLKARIGSALNSQDLRRIYACYPVLQALDPASGADLEPACAWLDKGNDCNGIDALAGAFPRARFVAVIRDPRAAIASLSGRLAGARAGRDRQHADIVAAAIYWCNIAQVSLRFARRHDGRAAIVRYEDVVLQPGPTVRALYAFLGLPALSEQETAARLAELEYGSSLASDETGTGISTRPLSRWKGALDPPLLDLIAEICGPTARLFGYPIAAPKRRLGFWRIAARMPGWRGKISALAKLLYLALRTPAHLPSDAGIGAFSTLRI